MIEKSTEQDLRQMLGNRVFGATFEKKDGTIRSGTFRLGVKKGQTGEGLSYNPREHDNLIVYDMRARGYRTINLNRLQSITVGGRKIEL